MQILGADQVSENVDVVSRMLVSDDSFDTTNSTAADTRATRVQDHIGPFQTRNSRCRNASYEPAVFHGETRLFEIPTCEIAHRDVSRRSIEAESS